MFELSALKKLLAFKKITIYTSETRKALIFSKWVWVSSTFNEELI